MARREALVSPSAPIMEMYAKEIGRMAAEPKGAAEMTPNGFSPPHVASSSWVGRKGARCFLTPIGPMPGPPPPCGMQNVLCRLRWHTSAPMCPGEVSPTCAFMLAPSMYTCPPCWWITSQISLMVSSYTPCVLGYVTMRAARLSLCFSAAALSPSTSTLPSASVPMPTIFMPHIAALAGLVPCAEAGMMHTLRWWSPFAWWYARIAISPAYSPAAPELGWSDMASKPVILQSWSARSSNICVYPCDCALGAYGCMLHVSFHVTGIISEVALSFMVHDPSEIIECTSERSFASRRAR
mmetsp:Transcript_10811/g.35495  ORF Transcript_10811/g.35495 Transcript_10811/m.35495 type:complete len:296 (-) Transcript_10811:1721-2608(-)